MTAPEPESNSTERGVRVVILSDGKRGHQNQNAVIARMLGDSNPLIMLLRHPEGGPAELALRLRFCLGGRKAIRQGAAAALMPKLLRPERPEAFKQFIDEIRESGRGARGADNRQGLRIFCVSSGTPPASMNLLVSALLGAESIVNMTPSLLPLRLFDLCVLPLHDGSAQHPPPNALVSPLALSCFDEAQASHIAAQICSRVGIEREGSYLGLAVGGPSRSAAWERDVLLEQIGAVLRSAKLEGLAVLATTSRRTPGWFASWLETRGRELADIPFILDAARDEMNPLPGMYKLCGSIIITADSFSMASEAVQAGLTPLLIRPSQQKLRAKLERGLQGLTEGRLARWFNPGMSLSAAETGPKREPNQEYERLRTELRRRLGLDS